MRPSTPLRAAALLAAGATLGACATGRAYHDAIVTDRPDFTESPLPVPRGAVQVELGDTYDRTDDLTTNAAGEVLVRLGVAERAELRLGLNSMVQARASDVPTGLEDASLGAKLQLVPEREGRHLLPTTSILLGTTLPTGSRALRSRALTPEAKLAVGWPLAEAWELSSNVNVASVPDAGARAIETVGSLSLGHDVTERVGSYLEWYGTHADRGVGPQYVNAGATYLFTPNAQLDLRAGAGLGQSRGDFFFGIGLSRRW